LLKPSKTSIVYTISGLLKGLFEDNGIEQRNVICSFHEIYNRCFMAEDPKEEFRKYVEEQFREQILGGQRKSLKNMWKNSLENKF